MLSAFGVDHGEFSKYVTTVAATGIGGGLGSARAKKKYKSKAAASGALRTGGGELLGQTAGGIAGLATRRPAGILAGGAAGSVGGAYLGNESAKKKAKREGWTK